MIVQCTQCVLHTHNHTTPCKEVVDIFYLLLELVFTSIYLVHTR